MRKRQYDAGGGFDAQFGSAADYELMLRFLHTRKVAAQYLPGEMVKMQTGGISNRSVGNRVKASMADLQAMRSHGLPVPPLVLLMKILRKSGQWL
ncbi:MAG: hypothetical protein INR69_11220 [Mucilaginibacter polytrichastri]|nr:hypothetical protein [Mucilaginibacter polytrichastri]